MNINELLPAIYVLGFFIAVYFIIQLIFNKFKEDQLLSIKAKNAETLLPLRIQAYERMALFLERISPNYLFLRLYEKGVLVGDFQQLLLKEIRDEYHHNIAQQVYVSSELWDQVTKAMNQVIALINTSASELSPDQSAINLSKKVLERILKEEANPTTHALKLLNREVQGLF